MSLDIRYLTNGKKSVYVVRDSGVTHSNGYCYDSKDDIPSSIRHYAPKGEPRLVGPDMARLFGAIDILYPDFPTCGKSSYKGLICIAESCKYAPDGDYTKCPYFPEYKETEETR